MADVLNFSPGPVSMRPEVAQALAQTPIPHRGTEFADLAVRVRSELQYLTNAPSPDHVHILVGSGTLANEAIALHIARHHPGQSGSVVSFGEFGNRLRAIARRWNLPSWDIVLPSDRPPDVADIMAKFKPGAWLWLTHCETSTGFTVDLEHLRYACDRAGVALYVDATSSVGNMHVDLRGIAGAAFSSGKGLGGVAGLAIVALGDSRLVYEPTVSAPSYLDLTLYQRAYPGVPFTQPSALYSALHAAMAFKDWPAHFADIYHASQTVRGALHSLDVELVGDWFGNGTNPAVVTFRPTRASSVDVGDALLRAGYLVSYMSGYLQHRNTMQVCFMGEFPKYAVDGLTTTLTNLLR